MLSARHAPHAHQGDDGRMVLTVTGCRSAAEAQRVREQLAEALRSGGASVRAVPPGFGAPLSVRDARRHPFALLID